MKEQKSPAFAANGPVSMHQYQFHAPSRCITYVNFNFIILLTCCLSRLWPLFSILNRAARAAVQCGWWRPVPVAALLLRSLVLLLLHRNCCVLASVHVGKLCLCLCLSLTRSAAQRADGMRADTSAWSCAQITRSF